jgi:hypothetical protein
MSAPEVGKRRHLSLPDLSSVSRLPRPIKAIVYLAMLAVITVAAISALAATVVIIGEITGAFRIGSLIGQ